MKSRAGHTDNLPAGPCGGCEKAVTLCGNTYKIFTKQAFLCGGIYKLKIYISI